MNIKSLLNNEITQEDFLRSNNATLLFKKLPNEICGLIVRKNDINIIIINDYLNEIDKKKALLHELGHLELDHTYKYRILSNDSTIYEKEADNYVSNLKFD